MKEFVKGSCVYTREMVDVGNVSRPDDSEALVSSGHSTLHVVLVVIVFIGPGGATYMWSEGFLFFWDMFIQKRTRVASKILQIFKAQGLLYVLGLKGAL